MNDTENNKKSNITHYAKNVFEHYIYSKKSLEDNLSLEAITVLKYLYFCMYKNSFKTEYNRQEVVTVSYPAIAEFSRISIETVKRIVPFLIKNGFLHLIDGGGKTRRKGTYCPGVKIYEFYPQN